MAFTLLPKVIVVLLLNCCSGFNYTVESKIHQVNLTISVENIEVDEDHGIITQNVFMRIQFLDEAIQQESDIILGPEAVLKLNVPDLIVNSEQKILNENVSSSLDLTKLYLKLFFFLCVDSDINDICSIGKNWKCHLGNAIHHEDRLQNGLRCKIRYYSYVIP